MPVDFHRLAIPEFVRVRRWYARHSVFAENQFLAEFQAAITRIDVKPLCSTLLHGTYHWVRVRRFPYVLYYDVVTPSLVKVYAVAHTRRHPGYWIKRTRRP